MNKYFKKIDYYTNFQDGCAHTLFFLVSFAHFLLLFKTYFLKLVGIINYIYFRGFYLHFNESWRGGKYF